ncbi:MAG: hypothetical protein WAM60_22045 [Candidatus Promineifilaceae bacterium]
MVGLQSRVTAISAGDNHTCAVTISGEVWCWGRNDYHQIGNGTMPNSNIPVLVTALPGDVVDIDAGGNHTCALTSNGEVWCWGFNTIAPISITGLPDDIVAINGGSGKTCALTSGGDAWCLNYYEPYQPFEGFDREVSAISTGGTGDTNTMAVLRDDTPKLSAGGTYSSSVGSAITLDAATDPIAESVSYDWTINNGPACNFDDATALNPSLTCNEAGIFIVTLVADNGHERIFTTAKVMVTEANGGGNPPTNALIGSSTAREWLVQNGRIWWLGGIMLALLSGTVVIVLVIAIRRRKDSEADS